MTEIKELIDSSQMLAEELSEVSNKAYDVAQSVVNLQAETHPIIVNGVDPFVYALTIFILACFIGYYVVWKVTPALHTPLMSVTNAVSSVIIVGALLAAGTSIEVNQEASLYGLIAIGLASINIFGGFIVTQRMLQMFKKKKK
jgi:NAD(P) transhydrogenase subunit alpha